MDATPCRGEHLVLRSRTSIFEDVRLGSISGRLPQLCSGEGCHFEEADAGEGASDRPALVFYRRGPSDHHFYVGILCASTHFPRAGRRLGHNIRRRVMVDID